MEELKTYLKTLVERKHCDEDHIPVEVIEDNVLSCNEALMNTYKPAKWSILNILPIPKACTMSSASNYTGVSLSSVVSKLYNKMLLGKANIRSSSKEDQNGFRPGRSIVSKKEKEKRYANSIFSFLYA
jgi:hypothetical protein